ncbi:cysteine desulfurase [Myxococcaceae bacterium GXIMD 01537]
MAEPTPGARADFPVLQRRIDGNPVIYLDNAATSLKPRTVIDAITEYNANVSANIHRGKHYLSEEASTRYEETRAQVARLLHAQGNEIVFTRNTTESLNLVASGLGLTREDTVVTTLDAHHSLLLPWRRVARVEQVRLDARGLVDLDHYAELLARRPRVVALSHCSNVTGVYTPLERMLPMAREVGALTVVDAAQSLPHRRVLVDALPIDFLAFSAHKMLGPTGLGVLYGRREHLESLSPALLGGGTVDWVDAERYELRKIPHRFEAGTPDIAAAYGFSAALTYLERVGFEAIGVHDARLAALMLEQVAAREWLRLVGPPAGVERAAIVSFGMRGVRDLSEVARALSDSYGVMCRSGHLCAQPLVQHLSDGQVLRASAYLYNTEEDVRTLFLALDELHVALGA